MIVVIPFCSKDWHLHKKNLDLCILMEGKVSAADGIDGALLCWDQFTSPEAVTAIKERAAQYFDVVADMPYTIPEDLQFWPAGPNNVFNKVAYHMQNNMGQKEKKRPWFFWEADATPLRPRWLTDIAAEYIKGGKPFMGHVVEGMGHFNGVAVYPWNTIQLAPSVQMAHRNSAWDVYMFAQDLRKRGDIAIHKANHLMQHVWAINPANQEPWNGSGELAHFDTWEDAATGPFRADFTCAFYHRCKDGSLADQIMAHNWGLDNVVPDHNVKGTVEISEIAKESGSVKFEGKCEILIVTHEKDYPWLWYCLQGIKKNLTGHSGVTLAIPTGQNTPEKIGRFQKIMPFKTYVYDEVKGKGMVQHMERICTADQICPDADFIMHMDADVIFHTPHTIDEYFINNRPVYVWRPWESLRGEDGVVSDCHQWKQYVDRDLGFDTIPYTMCRHASIYPRWFYPYFRAHVQQTVGAEFREYVIEKKNSFPQTFAEFPALGAFAWHKWKQHWHWVDASKVAAPKEHFKAYWSHAGIEGVEIKGNPIPKVEMEEKYGLPPIQK